MEIEAKIKLLQSMSESERESICNGCGVCCWGACRVNGIEYIQHAGKCPHLEYIGHTTRCKIYKERLKQKYCEDLYSAIRKGVLPIGCPYIKDIENYVGKVYDPLMANLVKEFDYGW